MRKSAIIFAAVLGASGAASASVLRVQLPQPARARHWIDVRSQYDRYVAAPQHRPLFTFQYDGVSSFVLRPDGAAAMPKLLGGGYSLEITRRSDMFFAPDPCLGPRPRRVVASDYAFSLLLALDPKRAYFSQCDWLFLQGARAWTKAPNYQILPRGIEVRSNSVLVLHFDCHADTQSQALALLYPTPPESLWVYGERLSEHPIASGDYRLERLDGDRAVLIRRSSVVSRAPQVQRHGVPPSSSRTDAVDPSTSPALAPRDAGFYHRLEFQFMRPD